jgi:hypothetical protein
MTAKLPPIDQLAEVRSSGPLVGPDELNMLLAPGVGLFKASAAGSGFKYRNIFLLLCCFWFLGRLLFFPEAVSEVLTFSPSFEFFSVYLQKRGWLYLFWLVLYSWSYARAWHFERVALVCFASEVTMLVIDYLTVFSYVASPMSPELTFFVLLRLAFMTCLLMNAIHAHRAPPAPRTLWS